MEVLQKPVMYGHILTILVSIMFVQKPLRISILNQVIENIRNNGFK